MVPASRRRGEQHQRCRDFAHAKLICAHRLALPLAGIPCHPHRLGDQPTSFLHCRAGQSPCRILSIMAEKKPSGLPGMEQLFNAPLPPRRRQHRAVAVSPFAGALFGDVVGPEAAHTRAEDEPPPTAASAASRGDQARPDVAERPPPRPEVRMKQCSGVADTPCEQQISARLKRCPTCTVENRRRQRQGYNRDHSQKNREPINVKRNDRRRKARENVPAAGGSAQQPAAAERRANRPR